MLLSLGNTGGGKDSMGEGGRNFEEDDGVTALD